MDLNNYIKWDEIWLNEVDITIDYFLTDKAKKTLKQFRIDTNVMMVVEECNLQILDGNEQLLIFQFSESGGQNESDTQGWSRDYWITFDQHFLLKDVEYEQG